MAEQDPLNPENDIFWEGPGAIRPSLQKAAAEAKARAAAEDRPYHLNSDPGPTEAKKPHQLNPQPKILGSLTSDKTKVLL